MAWDTSKVAQQLPQAVHPTDLRSLIDANPDALVVADPRGLVRFVNPAALELLGGTAQDLIGTPFPLSPDDHTGHLERPDGVAVDLDVRWTQLMWEGNLAWAAFISQKLAEGNSPFYNAELERRATQAELRVDQLVDELLQVRQSEAPLRERLASMERSLSQRELELHEIRNQQNFLQNRAQQAEHRAKETEEAALDGWATAEDRARKAESRVQSLEQEAENLQVAIKKLEERERKLRSDLERSPEELQEQALNAEIQLSEQLERIKTLESEIERLSARANSREDSRSDTPATLERLGQLEAALFEQEKRTTEAEERAELIAQRLNATQLAARELEEGMQHQLAEISARDKETQRLAYEDRLTGLANWNLFQQYLEYTADLVARQEGAAILAVVDVERLRAVNQTLGSNCGDEVLMHLAERMKGLIRPTDVLGRRRDDEFLIVIAVKTTEIAEARGTVAQISQALAQKILNVMEEPVVLDGVPLQINVGIGLALFQDHWQTVMDQAYVALERAKELGRNRFHFFGPDLAERIRRRVHMVPRLRDALDRQEFVMHYQPVVDLRSGKTVGMEALLRWHDPHVGLLEPKDFLAAAEESGLIAPIGEWAIQEACLVAAQHKDHFMSVNVSARQLMHGDFTRRFMKAVERARIRPEKMIVEISEITANRDPDRVAAVVNELSRWKVGLAIDDFGTGATNLSRLQQENLRLIKVDGSLIGQLPEDRSCLKLVLAATHLAASLQVQALAEGVETPEQLAVLRKMGCHLGQGRHLIPPVPAGGVKEILKKTWKFA